MKQVLLLDNTGNIIKPFNDYKSANHYRNMLTDLIGLLKLNNYRNKKYKNNYTTNC